MLDETSSAPYGHMETICKAQRAPRDQTYPRMNVIRSSEVMQDNEDLFASRENIPSTPKAKSVASSKFLESGVSTNRRNHNTSGPQGRNLSKESNVMAVKRLGEAQLRALQIEPPKVIGVSMCRWRGHTGVKRSQQKIVEPERRSRGATFVAQPKVEKAYRYQTEYSGEYVRPRAKVQALINEKEVRVSFRLALNVSKRAEKKSKLVSWGDRSCSRWTDEPCLPKVKEVTPKEIRKVSGSILKARKKLRDTAVPINEPKTWEAFRIGMSGDERRALDSLLAKVDGAKLLSTRLGVLQGAIHSTPTVVSDAVARSSEFVEDNVHLPKFGEVEYATPFRSVWLSLSSLCGFPTNKEYYHFFVIFLDFLTADDIPQLMLKFEMLSNYASTLPGSMFGSKVVIQLGSLLAQLGLGVAYLFQAEEEGTFLSSILEMRDSPLSIKVAAAAIAMIPAITAFEVGTMGESIVGVALDHLKVTATPHTTALSALAEVLDVIQRNLTRFSETGDIRDLFGRDSSQAWIMDANESIKLLDALRVDFKGKDVRGALRVAKNIYEKGLKSKHSQVASKNRELEAKILGFEAGLSRCRKPPVAAILVGPPGCGKTIFLEMLETAVKNRFHIQDKDVTIMYNYSATTFQKPPSILSILTLNDYFQVKSESPKLKEDPMDILQKFADSSPLDVEGASLELKNVYLQPDFVLVTTNTYSYQFSQSVGGVSKLDRRYKIIDFSWTDAFKEEAEEEGMPMDMLFRRGGYRTKHPVVYAIGNMKTLKDSDNQTVNFRIHTMDLETTDVYKVIGYLLTLESKRDEMYKTRMGAFAGMHTCACGIPVGSGCPCDTQPRIRLFDPVEEEKDGWEGPITDHAYQGTAGLPPLLEEGEEFQGATVSHSIEPNSIDVLVGISENFKDAMDRIPGPHTGFTFQSVEDSFVRTANKFREAVPNRFDMLRYLGWEITSFSMHHLLIFVTSFTGAAVVVKFLASKFERQGVVHSTSSFPKPSEDLPPLPKFYATQAAYLNPQAAAFNVVISRSRISDKLQTARMHALILTKFWLVLPAHFFTGFDSMPPIAPGDKITLEYRGTPFTLTYHPRMVHIPDKSKDLAYLYNPSMHSVSAGIFNILPEEQEVPVEKVKLGEFRNLVATYRDGRLSYVADTQMGSCGLPLVGEETGVIYGLHHARHFIPDFLGGGRCAGLFLSKKEARKVFAWGNENGCLSELLSDVLPTTLQSDVDEGKVLPGLHPQSDAWWYKEKAGASWPAHNHTELGHYASMDKEKFTVHRTTMYDTFSDRCKPYGNPWSGKAKIQADGSWQSVVTMRLDAAKCVEDNWDPDIMDEAVREMLGDLRIEKTRPLTDYEALCGSVDDVMINPKDMTKSLGPSAQAAGIKKEEAFVLNSEGTYVVHPTLLKWIEDLHKMLEGDEPMPLCFVKAQGKDEAYPTEKAEKGRKRFFYLSDWHMNHVSRTLILPLISMLAKQPMNSGIFITINAASPAWATFAAWLKEMGVDIMDADFSSFDLSHRRIMLVYIDYVVSIARAAGFQSKDAHKLRRLLFYRLHYALKMEGNIIRVMYQLCSGWIDTIFVNCFVVKFLFYYIYLKKCRESGAKFRHPREVMRVAAVGDDSMGNIHKSIQHFFNPQIIQETAAKLGYVMTAGDKSATMKFVTLADVVFLKRRFRVEGARVWAPLEKDSIFKALSYCTGRQNQLEQVARDEAACLSAAREMFLHGKADYDALVVEMLKHFPSARFNTYEDLLLEYDVGMFETWRNTKSKGIPVSAMAVTQLQGAVEVASTVTQLVVVPFVHEIMLRSPIGVLHGVAVAAGKTNSSFQQSVVLILLHHFLYLCPWWLSVVFQLCLNISRLARNGAFGTWSVALREQLSWTHETLVFLAGVGTLLYHRLKKPDISGIMQACRVVNVGVYAPIAEEYAKRGPLGWLLPLAEFVLYSQEVDWQKRVGPLIFHYVGLALPLPAAVCLHMYWNLMALTFMEDTLPPSWKGITGRLTYPCAIIMMGCTNVVRKACSIRTYGVVYPVAQGAVSCCPTISRGASVEDFPVPDHLRATRAYVLQVQICSTELNSNPVDVADSTSNVTHIVALDGDTTSVMGGAPLPPNCTEQDYQQFFGRPRLIKEYTTPLAAYTSSQMLVDWYNLAPIAGMKKQWGLFRGRPSITVSYTGSSSVMGLARVYFYPAPSTASSEYTTDVVKTYDAKDFNIVSTSNIPHLDLDLSSSCTCSIDLPYIHNKPITEWENDWIYGIIPINAVRQVGGLTAIPIKISVYVSYHDVQVSRIQFQGGVEVDGGLLSRGLGLAASLSRWFPITTPYTKMLELGSKAAYAMGYSRAVEPISKAVIARKYSPLGYMTGEASYASLLGSDPTTAHDMTYRMLPGMEEDSVIEIAKKSSQMVAGWVEATPVIVAPCVYGYEDGNSVTLSHMGQISMLFERWTGAIDVRLQIVASPLVRWRIGVVVIPPHSAIPATFPTDGAYVTHVIEVAGSVDYEFEVPFVDWRPYRITSMTYVNPGAFSGEEAQIRYYTISAPTGPSATSVFPHVNVWMKAGKDYSVSVPSLLNVNGFTQLQGGYQEMEIASLGEKVDSLRVLAKRKTFMAAVAYGASNGKRMTWPADGLGALPTTTYNATLPSEVTTFGTYFTFDTFLRQLFWGYTGGTAYTMYPVDNGNWIFGTMPASFGGIYTDASRLWAQSRGAAIFYTDENKVAEVVVPDRSGVTYKKSNWQLPALTSSGRVECVVANPINLNAASAAASWNVYSSAGDDRMYVLHLGALRFLKRV